MSPADLRGLRQELFRACDPGVPLFSPTSPADPDRYVDFDALGLRGAGRSPTEDLLETIRLAGPEPTAQLFTGFPGTGKTTELGRLQELLLADVEDRSFVLLIDALQWMDRYMPPTVVDVLRVLAWTVEDAAERLDGRTPDAPPAYAQKLWSRLSGDEELARNASAEVERTLMEEIRDNARFRDRATSQLLYAFQPFALEAHEVIGSAVRRIRLATGAARVVILVDGLEKLAAKDPSMAEQMERGVETLFASHVRWLRPSTCHLVYTLPLWLRFRTPNLGSLYSSDPLTLPMVKLWERSGAVATAGVQAMTQMAELRLAPAEQLFGADTPAALKALALASGGYPRDLLRLLRDVIRGARALPIGMPEVRLAIDHLAEDYALATARIEPRFLAHIAVHQHLPPGDEALRTLTALFEQFQVLTYRNGREWYGPHPLVEQVPSVQEAILQLGGTPRPPPAP